jgi:hypothetical protein
MNRPDLQSGDGILTVDTDLRVFPAIEHQPQAAHHQKKQASALPMQWRSSVMSGHDPPHDEERYVIVGMDAFKTAGRGVRSLNYGFSREVDPVGEIVGRGNRVGTTLGA